MTHEHAAATAAAAAAIPTDGSPPQDAPYPVDSSNSRDPHKLPPADAVTFNTAISGLGIAHRPQQAEAVLNHMLDAGFNADTTSFTATISAYSRAQRPADGTRTHHHQQHGSPPGARLLFSPPPPPPALSDPLRNKPATQLIPPSPFFIPCVRVSAARVLERMVSSHVKPDTVAVNTVLSAYAHAADSDGARSMLSAFVRRAAITGELPPDTKPDLISYNTVLLACANAAKPAEAEATFADISAAGLQPSQVSYSTVLSAHARAGNVAAAQEWLERMVAHGIVPDAVSYNGVCSAHARVGDAAAAQACLKRMEASGVEVTPTTHAIVINAFVQSGDLDAAEASLCALVASGEPLTAASFNTLISARAKAKKPQQAEEVAKMMQRAGVSPSLVTFNALANAHAAAGDLPAVEGVVRRLRDANLKPDRYTYGALLQAAGKSNHAATARAHVEALLNDGNVPLNDFLLMACKRAVGERIFAELHNKHGQRSRETRAQKRRSPEPWPSPASSMGRATPIVVDEEEEEGWTTQTSRRRQRSGAASKSKPAPIKAPYTPPHSASKAISKKSPRGHGSAKKSPERPMAQRSPGISAAFDGSFDGSINGSPMPLRGSPSPPFRFVGLPMRRSRSAIELKIVKEALVHSPVPMTRSAASELALNLGQTTLIG